MSAAEVAAKLDRVRWWLAGSGHGGALFTSQPGVAWVTGGLDWPVTVAGRLAILPT